jgi:hypothetical protein
MTKVYLGKDVYDVDLTGLLDNYILVYDEATGKFKPEPKPGDMLKSVYDTNDDGKVNSAVNADVAPWTGISGKPATFPPDPHNQDWTTVTGKPATFPPDAHNQASTTLTVDTASFNRNLTSAEDTVQKALDKLDDLAFAGAGDMLKSTYDTNNDGKVENALNVIGGTADINSIKKAGVSGSPGMILNSGGAYLHLGNWGQGRLATDVCLVNTAYMADYMVNVGTGATFTADLLGTIPLPFGAWVVTTPAYATFTGNQTIYLFPDAGTGYIDTSVVIPASWYGKTMVFDFWWWHGTSGGNCDIALEGRYQNTGSLRAAADFTTRQQLNASNAIRKTSYTIAACYPPVEIPCGIHIRLIRWGAAAGDTAAVDMYLLCAQLRVY